MTEGDGEARATATGFTLDTGALIGLERGSQRIRALLANALLHHRPVRIPCGALAQAWRAPARQVVLTRLIRSSDVQSVPLDAAAAKRIGLLCAVARTTDVVEASVADCARSHGDMVVTTDPADLSQLLPAEQVIAI